MSDTAETKPPSTAAAGKKIRGRPTGSKSAGRSETPQQRIDRLRKELQQAEEAKRVIEARRDAIVGRAVVAHAFAHADYRRQLVTLLRSEVKSKAELEVLAELLG